MSGTKYKAEVTNVYIECFCQMSADMLQRITVHKYDNKKVKVKVHQPRYRPGQAQRVPGS